MPEDNYRQVTTIANSSWNSFVSTIRHDVDNLIVDRRKLKLEQRKIIRIQKILQYQGNDITLLLQHKDSILSVDESLAKNFSILEAFKKRDNLNNDVAIRVYDAIINSESLKNTIAQIDEIKEKIDLLNDKITSIIRLIRSDSFDLELINELCEKHNISSEEQVKILLYPVIKTAKKPPRRVENRPSLSEDGVELQIPEEPVTLSPEVEIANIGEPSNLREQNKAVFANLKERYEQITSENNDVLNKYYKVIQGLSKLEKEYYRILCSKNEEYLLNVSNDQLINECGYDEPLAKAFAMKMFESKDNIDEIMKSIVAYNYEEQGDIELLEEFINIYESFVNRLKTIEPKIIEVEKAQEAINNNNKAFFLTDSTGSPFVFPTVINEYHTNLSTFIQKLQNETNVKKSSRVVHLKGVEYFENKLGRTIFLSINSKVFISFIKLHLPDNSEGAIILTAIQAANNNIKEITEEVVRDNFAQLINQIEAIEKGDISELTVQDKVVNSLLNGGKR